MVTAKWGNGNGEFVMHPVDPVYNQGKEKWKKLLSAQGKSAQA
jgi:hypothetical protein